MKPHRCPVCEGSGVYIGCESTGTCSPTRASHPCHGCNASGIVWDGGFVGTLPPSDPYRPEPFQPWPYSVQPDPFTISTPYTGGPWPYGVTWQLPTNVVEGSYL